MTVTENDLPGVWHTGFGVSPVPGQDFSKTRAGFPAIGVEKYSENLF